MSSKADRDEIERLTAERDEARRGCLALRTELEEARRERSNWEETARHHANGEAWYRDIVDTIGEALGTSARTQDDGNVLPEGEVLRAKVGELAAAAIAERDEARAQVSALREALEARPSWSSSYDYFSKWRARVDSVLANTEAAAREHDARARAEARREALEEAKRVIGLSSNVKMNDGTDLSTRQRRKFEDLFAAIAAAPEAKARDVHMSSNAVYTKHMLPHALAALDEAKDCATCGGPRAWLTREIYDCPDCSIYDCNGTGRVKP